MPPWVNETQEAFRFRLKNKPVYSKKQINLSSLQPKPF
jgi:hypothetical protein